MSCTILVDRARESESIIQDLTTTHMDPVHALDDFNEEAHVNAIDLDDFKNKRVGSMDETKQTWVSLRAREISNSFSNVVNLRADKPLLVVDASLYTYTQTNPIRDERDFMGDVSEILTRPVETLDGDPTAIIFYSVGGNFEGSTRGAGTRLINDVCGSISDESIKKSTLSPLRGFSGWLDEKGVSDQTKAILLADDDVLKRTALLYLMERKNPVQMFHTKKMGAYIADIKVKCNAPQSKDAKEGLNVMVNYGYLNDAQREFNKEAATQGQLVLASHLYDSVRKMEPGKFDQIPQEKPDSPWVVKPAMF